MSSSISHLLDIEEPTVKKKKRVIATIDAETDPFKYGRVPEAFVWGFYDGNLYSEFDTAEELLEFIYDYPDPLLIYGHNAGKFDYHWLVDYMESKDSLMIIDGRISKFKIGNAEFRDSYNLFNFPLSDYKKDDINYGIMEKEERSKPKNKKEISLYLEKDCVYLYELVSDFVEKYGMHLTQAGAAMKIWQKMGNLKAPETDAKFYDTFSDYYYGGRVECFVGGIIDKLFSMIDIKSAYPFAMMSRHPISGIDGYTTIRGVDCITEINKRGVGHDSFSSAFFRIRAISNGAFPFRCGKQKKLIFPSDNLIREYCITGWELQAAIDLGKVTIKDYLEITIFDELIDFVDYVDRFFLIKSNAKECGDKLSELFAKLFLNALYGKFASDPRTYKEYKIADCADDKDDLEYLGYEDNGLLNHFSLLCRAVPEERHRFYNVATSASITGYVRAYLFRALSKAGGLLYCDTDSIAAYDISGIDLSGALGGWGSDGEFDEGAIAGKKMYAFKYTKEYKKKNKLKNDYKYASKGARITPKQIFKIAKGGNIVYKSQAPTFSINKEPRFIKREIVKTV